MITKLVRFIFETLHLKQVKHEGRRMAGVQFPDSVAEYSLNAAQIGYILAHMEGSDANKVAAMLIWHDLAETRIGDIHKIGARYWKNKHEVEQQVVHDQLQDIDKDHAIKTLLDEYKERSTLESKIAKDADYLEQAFQAKIYLEQGYTAAQDWIDNVGKALQTSSAKHLWETMCSTRSCDRWRMTSLKYIPSIHKH